MRLNNIFWGMSRNGLILAGVFISVIFWLLEASNHVIFFADSDMFEALFAPTWHELWMRLTVVGVFMAFAFIANRIVTARRKAEDAARPEAWVTDALFRPKSRAAFHRLVNLGLTDAIRARQPDRPGPFTFWDYQAAAWERARAADGIISP